jgi:type I restriction-modification system DNA methylase subunit
MAKYYGDGYVKEIIQKLERLGRKYSTWRVFTDFVALAAIEISAAVDLAQKAEREAQYIEIAKKYDKAERPVFAELFCALVMALEAAGRPRDVLGEIFHALELHNRFKGQFFTPQPVADFMAECAAAAELGSFGYVSMCEPAAGSGVMALAAAHVMDKRGFNHSENLLVHATDVDLKCVHMSYIQLALYGIPAVVTHGNSLTGKRRSRWPTPLYVLGGWAKKERMRRVLEGLQELFKPPDEQETG